ncbi:DUF4384 domain-containing protein [Deinococcus peraridilitoris]|uniref:DUF4384 domain-containing protein n=1 Tax=Deinococcus peraridilitoris (strain DSM 19664 / LMG 22246 / CIP 109416 / KR-200) TaxID=937777 RepID=L0A5B0_DEIPD|nr:DUF4384 domain-containing protein [Deinococcus peraridilitoris]AFZ68195.1 hypothetical protein Deipe_2731 [Deinococcus peraridilitoris DSM 19664]
MKNLLIATSLLLGLSVAAAQARITPQSIIVNPAPADLKVQVWVDRDQSGNGTPNYAVGDRIRIYTSVTDDAYVYLFNVNPDGSVDQILPNRYASGANFVKANTVKVFPATQDRFTFDIAAPYGVNKVLALASKTQLNLNQISSFQNNEAFATVNVRGQENFAQALSIVVNPVPRNSWITDVAYYNVAGAGSYGNQPTTVVVSQPAPRTGAIINIDITIRPFTGAQNVQTYNENAGWRSEFSSNARLDGVYAYYEGELKAQGYRLAERKTRGNQIEGRYARGTEETKLKVKQTGSRFEVSVERER